jgi:hypothetical protein
VTTKFYIGWCILLSLACFAIESRASELKPYADFSQNKSRLEGYFTLLIDDETGSVYLDLPPDPQTFIYQSSLPWGLGSNDIGLDRGQQGNTRLVRFERIGRKVMLRQLNTAYRASGDSRAEMDSVEQAFASSIIWGFDVVVQDDVHTVIDYTPFLLSDIHGVTRRLKELKEGDYTLDLTRSAAYFARTRNFPKNTELEASVTFTAKKAGQQISTVAPDPHAVTVHMHHSLIELPDGDYSPREFHPGSGFWARGYLDYSVPLDQEMMQRRIGRHRLKKKSPHLGVSEPVTPIVYYLDPGVPEPVRSALLEGARWWNKAFSAAGFIDGFQVKMLPEDADPMDVRYNVIQWVHRSTRGWSYGRSVVDPRTGEIIKGHVTLGSLRARQDLRIAQGLLSSLDDKADEMQAMALARIRQLSAHEVGHTLGLAHNYAASVRNRSSVMDYPHPRIKLDGEGKIDLSDAYAVGIGDWDKVAIAYGYSEVQASEENTRLAAILQEATARGLKFIADADARPSGSAHADAHLWDSGDDIIDAFHNLVRIRAKALANMGVHTIPKGTPYSELAEILVPIYYLHRYQLEAVVKLIGGVNYRYELRDVHSPDGVQAVLSETQAAALQSILETISADFLSTPDHLLQLITPKPIGYTRNRESPPSRTLPLYDSVTVAEAAVEETLRLLLDPARLARLVQQHAVDNNIKGTQSLLESLLAASIAQQLTPDLRGEIQKRTNLLVAEHLLNLVYGKGVPEVKAIALSSLVELKKSLKKQARQSAHFAYLLDLIETAQQSGSFKRRNDVAQIPPGSPI